MEVLVQILADDELTTTHRVIAEFIRLSLIEQFGKNAVREDNSSSNCIDFIVTPHEDDLHI